MPFPLRIATFNCENLFRRSKVLNLKDEQLSGDYLRKITELQILLDKQIYDDSSRQQIFELSSQLAGFIDFRVDMGSLGTWKKRKEDGVTGFSIYKKCAGRTAWAGQLIFLPEPFSDSQRKNTAKVISETKADILCLVEVEGMNAIHAFNSQALNNKYAQYISIDSPNDPRGIDVACLSKFPIIQLKTHIFDNFGDYHPVFSRDCLEVKVDLGTYGQLNVLCNHFKSQRAFSQAEENKAAAKRKAQAQCVADILKQYNLAMELVVVMGDLNEDTSSPYQSLEALFNVADLYPLIDRSLPVKERYTHYYAGGSGDKKYSQLDYIFVSKPLYNSVKRQLGFIREGIFWDEPASDHAAVWAEFEL